MGVNWDSRTRDFSILINVASFERADQDIDDFGHGILFTRPSASDSIMGTKEHPRRPYNCTE